MAAAGAAPTPRVYCELALLWACGGRLALARGALLR
jgi:hypothetical protein